jgi:hypothetical protein
MISKKTIAVICDDVGVIYQMSTETTFDNIFKSEEFKRIAKMIRRECPEMDDRQIIRSVLKAYSRRLLHTT